MASWNEMLAMLLVEGQKRDKYFKIVKLTQGK